MTRIINAMGASAVLSSLAQMKIGEEVAYGSSDVAGGRLLQLSPADERLVASKVIEMEAQNSVMRFHRKMDGVFYHVARRVTPDAKKMLEAIGSAAPIRVLRRAIA